MTMRRRIEVNLEELDQIIDRSTQAPLSQSEGQKLKTAIHAMAERLSWKRTTEKTSAVLPQDAAADKPETGKSTPASHGRHNAAAFSGAARVASTHATLHSGDLCPECRRGKVYRLKEPATLVRFVGTHHWKQRYSKWSDCVATPAGRSSKPTNRRGRVRRSTMRRPWR